METGDPPAHGTSHKLRNAEQLSVPPFSGFWMRPKEHSALTISTPLGWGHVDGDAASRSSEKDISYPRPNQFVTT